MKKTAKQSPPELTPVSEERWEVVQVAAFLKATYQSARNQMLQGKFGRSEYDAEKRKLTVLASKVRATARKR